MSSINSNNDDNQLLNTRSLSIDDVNDRLLKEIAEERLSDDKAMSLVNKDKTINQMKLFILVQAKKELNRIIKLMAFLDKVQDAYENKVEENIENFSLKQYNDIIYTINQCLYRANEVVKSVIKDDTLTNILIYTDNSVTNNGIINTNAVAGLETPESRDKVIKAVNSILSKLDNLDNDSTLLE